MLLLSNTFRRCLYEFAVGAIIIIETGNIVSVLPLLVVLIQYLNPRPYTIFHPLQSGS